MLRQIYAVAWITSLSTWFYVNSHYGKCTCNEHFFYLGESLKLRRYCRRNHVILFWNFCGVFFVTVASYTLVFRIFLTTWGRLNRPCFKTHYALFDLVLIGIMKTVNVVKHVFMLKNWYQRIRLFVYTVANYWFKTLLTFLSTFCKILFSNILCFFRFCFQFLVSYPCSSHCAMCIFLSSFLVYIIFLLC